MIKRKAKYKTCKECGRRDYITPDVHGCDVCKKEMGADTPRLSLRLFFEEFDKIDDADLCSWRCFFKRIVSAKCDGFIALPYIQMRGGAAERVSLAGFLKAADKFRMKKP